MHEAFEASGLEAEAYRANLEDLHRVMDWQEQSMAKLAAEIILQDGIIDELAWTATPPSDTASITFDPVDPKTVPSPVRLPAR